MDVLMDVPNKYVQKFRIFKAYQYEGDNKYEGKQAFAETEAVIAIAVT